MADGLTKVAARQLLADKIRGQWYRLVHDPEFVATKKKPAELRRSNEKECVFVCNEHAHASHVHDILTITCTSCGKGDLQPRTALHPQLPVCMPATQVPPFLFVFASNGHYGRYPSCG